MCFVLKLGWGHEGLTTALLGNHFTSKLTLSVNQYYRYKEVVKMGSTSAPPEEKRPRVGVGVFVFRSRDDRRFVFGLRKGSHGAGKYNRSELDSLNC